VAGARSNLSRRNLFRTCTVNAERQSRNRGFVHDYTIMHSAQPPSRHSTINPTFVCNGVNVTTIFSRNKALIFNTKELAVDSHLDRCQGLIVLARWTRHRYKTYSKNHYDYQHSSSLLLYTIHTWPHHPTRIMHDKIDKSHLSQNRTFPIVSVHTEKIIKLYKNMYLCLHLVPFPRFCELFTKI